jgi:hypothetical protein
LQELALQHELGVLFSVAGESGLDAVPQAALPVGEPEVLRPQLLPFSANASLQLLLSLLAFGKEPGERDLHCAREEAPSQHHRRFLLLLRW